MGNLDSARLKLERAQEHLTSFNSDFASWLALNPYEAVREKDEELGLDVLCVRIVDMPKPPKRLGALIGDYATNLRDCLDHAVFGLLPEQPEKPSEIAFPIFIDDANYSKAAKRRVGLLAPEVQAAVERLQPYHAEMNVMSHPLVVINDLANAGKHREVAIVVRSFMYSFGGPNPNQRITLTLQFSEDMKEDPCMPIPPLSEKAVALFEFKVEPVFAVVFQERSGKKNRLFPTEGLPSLYHHILDTVLPMFEPYD